MPSHYVLGIDCGTQSLRAALYRPDGVQIASASHAYTTNRPQVNWAEQNPADWWDALCRTVPQCIEQAGIPGNEVGAIACDGTSCTAVFCDTQGIPLRPAILWMDLRAAGEAKRVEATEHPVLDFCGRRISAEWMLPKTLWIRDHEPDVFERAARIIEGVDWLTYRLTGRWVTSTGNAAGKRHWTPDQSWPVDLYETLGVGALIDKGPDEVVYVGEPVGTLLPDAAQTLGLSSGCIVSHAGMDGWTSPIGKNCFGEGCVSLTLGTSTVILAETGAPEIIDGVMGPFPDGIRKDYSVYEAGQTSSGSTIGWYLSLAGATGEEAYRLLEDQARALPAGSNGLVVFDAWRGNRTPYFDPQARGIICGLTLEHTPAHLYRAVLEGCALGIRNVFEILVRGGCPVREVRACGTGAGNRLWVEIIASATQTPILVSEEKQATCLGSAMCAAVACQAHPDLCTAAQAMAPAFDTIEPQPNTEVYDEVFAAYLDLYANTKGAMARLSERTGESTP